MVQKHYHHPYKVGTLRPKYWSWLINELNLVPPCLLWYIYHAENVNFLNLVFLITLPPQKKDRQDLKMGCIDVSRRQLQFVLKIRV